MKKKSKLLALFFLIFILAGCNFFKNEKNISNEQIKKDAFIMYNPKGIKEESIEIYNKSMAKDLFETTYAYKIYEKKNKNLEKTRDYIMEECVDYANNLYFVYSQDLEKMKKNKSIKAKLPKENGENFRKKSLYKTQLLAICDTSSRLYYAINDLKLVNDLMGNSYDDLKTYAKDFVEKNGENLLDENMKNYGLKYDEKSKETIEKLIISYLDEFKDDLPHKDGSKENIKIEKEVKLTMKTLGVSKYFKDLKKAVREVYKED